MWKLLLHYYRLLYTMHVHISTRPYSLKQQNNINTVMYTSSTLPTINISVCLLTSAVIVIGDKIVCNCSIGSEIVQYSYILWHKTATTIIIIINRCLNVIWNNALYTYLVTDMYREIHIFIIKEKITKKCLANSR